MTVAGSMPEASGVVAPPNSLPSSLPGLGHPGLPASTASFAPGQNRPVPWWLWANILSVDAPAVALLWAALFARASGVSCSSPDAAVLFLSVWVIYVSDRLLDGWTAKNRSALQNRHIFCEQHRTMLVALLIGAAAAIFWLTLNYLPRPEQAAGLKLGSLLALYMTCIHAARGRVAKLLPKEITVGVLFAIGTTLPLWSRMTHISWEAFVEWSFFALLCSLNCLCIECWEHRLRGGALKTSAHSFARWGDLRITQMAAALAIAAFLICLAPAARGAFLFVLLAVLHAAVFLLLLNRYRTKLSPAALRVLADAALAIPPLLALAIRA